jgi:hypothetical protein
MPRVAKNAAVPAVALLVLMLSGQAAAFQLSPVHPRNFAKLAVQSKHPGGKVLGVSHWPRIQTAGMARGLRTAVAQAAPSGSSPPAADMDERIYNFNKIVIDTVYSIICFLYPVTGGPRDFARFYVLETVARVPYFAYLSVMHLRETFGEREEKQSERMRTVHVLFWSANYFAPCFACTANSLRRLRKNNVLFTKVRSSRDHG